MMFFVTIILLGLIIFGASIYLKAEEEIKEQIENDIFETLREYIETWEKYRDCDGNKVIKICCIGTMTDKEIFTGCMEFSYRLQSKYNHTFDIFEFEINSRNTNKFGRITTEKVYSCMFYKLDLRKINWNTVTESEFIKYARNQNYYKDIMQEILR